MPVVANDTPRTDATSATVPLVITTARTRPLFGDDSDRRDFPER